MTSTSTNGQRPLAPQTELVTAGRDTKYGYGLVQAKAAYDRIKSLGCGK